MQPQDNVGLLPVPRIALPEATLVFPHWHLQRHIVTGTPQGEILSGALPITVSLLSGTPCSAITQPVISINFPTATSTQ